MSVAVALVVAVVSTILLDLSHLFRKRAEDKLPPRGPWKNNRGACRWRAPPPATKRASRAAIASIVRFRE